MTGIANTHARNQTLIGAIVAESCHQLFADYALSLERQMPDAQPTGDICLCGVIGFTGPHCRGTLLLACTERPLQRTNPASAPLRDWAAELSNQLLGRIKNRLLRHGLELFASTPIVLRGNHLAPLPRRDFLPILFSSDAGYIGVWLDYELSPHVALSPEETADDDVLLEGDSVLF